MEVKQNLNENWLLWLELCTKYPKFRKTYNFCTRALESQLGMFTVILKIPEFFNRFTELTGDQLGAAPFVTLKNRPWSLSINLPQRLTILPRPTPGHQRILGLRNAS